MNRRPLIELRHVDACHGTEPVLHNLLWTLRAGKHCLLRGPNGSGKTTFLRLLQGKAWPRKGQKHQRLYHFSDPPSWSPLTAAAHITLVGPEQQNVYAFQDWDASGFEVIASGFHDTDLLQQDLSDEEGTRLQQWVDHLRLNELASRPVNDLSQGEMRRILIARATINGPKVLLLDEFDDGLDEESVSLMDELLENLARGETTLVMSSHRSSQPAWVEEILHFREGVIEQREAAETRSTERAGSHSFSLAPAPLTESPSLIRITDANIYLGGAYVHGGTHVLKDLNWELRPGHHWVISGENGSGKTTFLRLLQGEVRPGIGGRIDRFSKEDGITIAEARRRIGLFYPALQSRYEPHITTREVVESAFWDPTETTARKAETAAGWFGVADLLERPWSTLSHGQARRCLLARAFAIEPEILLLDEPFDGLDEATFAQLYHQLDRLRVQGTNFVLSCHRLDDVPAWFNRHGVIKDGFLKIAQ